jgi:transcriptional regulator with XRE-family HTH domain
MDIKVDTREKFRSMLNDIAERDGIRRFNKLVEMTGISANTFTNIKQNRVKGVDIDTFWKLNEAFGKRYNVKWFQGDSQYMLIEDYLAAKQNHEQDITPRDDRQLKITERAHDIQIAVLGHLVNEPEVIEGMAADDDPRPHLPTWADTLLGILSKQIAENEVLHAELKKSISEVQEMKSQLSDLLTKIK